MQVSDILKTKHDRGKRKGKQFSISEWKQLADSWYSRYIRLKYYENGKGVKCVTCGKYGEIEKMQAGHYEKRSYLPTRFDDENVFPQCHGCNVMQKGNYPLYAKFIKDTFGHKRLDKLRNRAEKRGHKFDRIKAYEIIEKYMPIVDKLLTKHKLEPWWKETKIEKLIRENIS